MKEMERVDPENIDSWSLKEKLLSPVAPVTVHLYHDHSTLLSCQSPANRGTLWSELYFYLGSSPSPREST